jgi:hypothetical protein
VAIVLELFKTRGEIVVMKMRVARIAILMGLGIASIVSYVNDLDVLVAALQLSSLIAFKKMTYDRATANLSQSPRASPSQGEGGRTIFSGLQQQIAKNSRRNTV